MNRTRVERALVSGASGFVGQVLVSHLEASATRLRFGDDDWLDQVASADFRDAPVFPLAPRAPEARLAREQAYFRDHLEKTRALAFPAAPPGAARLGFLSSVKVNADEKRPQ